MKRLLFALFVFLAAFPVTAQQFSSDVLGDPYVSGDMTVAGDIIVDGGEIGVTGDLDLLQLSSGDLDVNGTSEFVGNMTFPATGAGDISSYKIVMEANQAAGPVTHTGSIFCHYDGSTSYMVFAAPDDSGVETNVLGMSHDNYFFATDNTVDIGMNGACRPKNIYAAGNIAAQGTSNISAGGDVTAGDDLFVNGGNMGTTGDPDLFGIANDAVTINGMLDVTTGNITIYKAGTPANSYKVILNAEGAGPETQTSSLFTAYGADPYLVVATPNATGVETNTLHINHNSFLMATDDTVDIGATCAGRPKDIFLSGNLDAEVGAITAQTGLTTDTGDITATTGAVLAGTTVTATGDLIVNGGEIGLTGDLDLIQISANTLTVNGTITATNDIDAPGGVATELTYWYQDNVAISQTDVVLNMDGNTSRAEVPTVRAGSVIGIAVYTNEAWSAGTLTVDATIDGVKTGLTAAITDATQTKVSTQAKDTDAFTAGQRIGVKLTTDGTWAPVTADITVVVLIEQ